MHAFNRFIEVPSSCPFVHARIESFGGGDTNLPGARRTERANYKKKKEEKKR